MMYKDVFKEGMKNSNQCAGHQFIILKNQSKLHTCFDEHIERVCNRSVNVYSSPIDLIHCTCRPQLNFSPPGIVFSDGIEYAIFLDRYHASKCYPGLKNSSVLFVLFHEYAHILQGDVIYDLNYDCQNNKPNANLQRIQDSCSTGTELENNYVKQNAIAERCANGYAYCKLKSVLQNNFEDEKIEFLEQMFQRSIDENKSFILPNSQGYQDRYGN